MLRNAVVGLAVFFALGFGNAVADEAKVRQKLQSKFPAMTVDSVTKAPFAGLYEVVLDGEIVYTDDKVDYFFGGNIYDIRTLPPRNLTQDSTQRLAVKTLASAQGNAVKRVKGNGKRILYTFEDPNCGYCKQLYRELEKVSDITVYVYMTPILSKDSADKARAVWCAKDRAKAWDDVMQTGAVSASGANCATPIDKNLQMMRRFGISGTPAIYLSDGRQIGGYVPAEKIEQALKSIGSK
jgi:thiol:disulfide interchange protein DsbC